MTTAPSIIPPNVRITADWPDQLVELGETIGAAAALRLAIAYGGVYFRVPLKPSARIVNLIGPEAAAALCNHYGAHRLQLPMASILLRRFRREAVLADVRTRHLSVAAGARLLGTTARNVRRLLRETNEGKAASARKLAQERQQADAARQLDLIDWISQADVRR